MIETNMIQPLHKVVLVQEKVLARDQEAKAVKED
jgi:hypothetical protein